MVVVVVVVVGLHCYLHCQCLRCPSHLLAGCRLLPALCVLSSHRSLATSLAARVIPTHSSLLPLPNLLLPLLLPTTYLLPLLLLLLLLLIVSHLLRPSHSPQPDVHPHLTRPRLPTPPPTTDHRRPASSTPLPPLGCEDGLHLLTLS